FPVMFRRFFRPLSCAVVAATLLAVGCGGSDGEYFQSKKQQVTVSIAPSGTVLVKPGEIITLTANAKALRDKLTAMSWSIQPLSTTHPGTAEPVLGNADCANATMSKDDHDYTGSCTVTVSVPKVADPLSWTLHANATAENKGQAADTVILEVVTPEYPESGLQITVPQHLMATEDLYTYQIVSIPATMTANYPISNPTYKWTLITGPTGTSTLMLAGTNSSVLQFIPREPGYYHFQVEGRGIVNGREQTATDDVILRIYDSRSHRGLVVTTNPAQRVDANTVVQLVGSATFNGSDVYNPSYQWQQIQTGSEPQVALINPNSPTASFIAPATPTTQVYTFELIVTAVDHNGTRLTGKSSTYVTVYGTGTQPVGQEIQVYVSAPAKVEGGDFQTITATATYKGQALPNAQYEWRQTEGPPVIISNEHTASPSFYLNVKYDTRVVFVVTATDVVNGETVTGSSTVELVITPPQTNP
ncbi:MAG: hypothetical protein IKU14_01010, partial [Rhodocyclaceae bacterium]|nr:hypothetical protein [Rhodocyclaceae bacterium]